MLTEGQVVVHERIGDEDQRLRRLVLKGPIAQVAKAGQFVAIQVQDPALSSFDPLLRRPISIAGISPERDEITLLYRIMGRGTEILARARCGERLSIMGPLGNGFSFPKQEGELWLVAGGIGVFPLYALAQSALARGLKVRLFWGGESHSFLDSAGLSSWQALGLPIHLSTLDGSIGQKGFVTEQVQEHLSRLSGQVVLAGQMEQENQESQGSQVKTEHTKLISTSGSIIVATCGPKKMMQAVTELCMNFGVSVEVSLEERMGCAVGACLGCVCTLRDEAGNLIHKKVCQDGPVFRGEEVVWDESC
ncbi:dihydroorotate dehydrogenase electron transfer subunit [Desulfosporosinus sp. Sb-LF]|uniref:dihydroorotate dehydrogenase electron transfer subunit n=1 Tax=Desulfosporosinus sp. Sb-LF TaxID=2560027 RepID=UPI00107FB3B6|nr:dihydroorotate dehydrogenase electron transfer subunit [Desulfosporosinus sp. Sb-LF]TGE32715.1 dihydroorotate dehydrogenase electron transfer subunit [Desulfosporosinus sp. Sb-LF]